MFAAPFFYIKINLPQLDIQVPYQPPQPPPADVARAKVTNDAPNKTLILTWHSLPRPPPGAPPLRPPCAARLQGGRGLDVWKVSSLLSSWVGGNFNHKTKFVIAGHLDLDIIPIITLSLQDSSSPGARKWGEYTCDLPPWTLDRFRWFIMV